MGRDDQSALWERPPDNLRVFVCTEVADQGLPVLLVVRDSDFSFLCGGTHKGKDWARAVGIGHMFDRDPSLLEALGLVRGEELERKSAGDDWVVKRAPDDARREFDLKSKLPDELLDLSEDEFRERAWGGDDMIRIDDIGAFLRVLFVALLTDGYSVIYGTWIKVAVDDLRTAWEVWSTDAYATLTIDGELANALPPWRTETLGRRVHAAVAVPDQLPFVVRSDDPFVHGLLMDRSSHSEVLNALDRYI